jgi:hypothetical protein
MLRCEAIAAHMLKPAEVAAQFLKRRPQFAEMCAALRLTFALQALCRHWQARPALPTKRVVYSIGIYVAARASACPGREEARPFEAAGKPFPV